MWRNKKTQKTSLFFAWERRGDFSPLFSSSKQNAACCLCSNCQWESPEEWRWLRGISSTTAFARPSASNIPPSSLQWPRCSSPSNSNTSRSPATRTTACGLSDQLRCGRSLRRFIVVAIPRGNKKRKRGRTQVSLCIIIHVLTPSHHTHEMCPFFSLSNNQKSYYFENFKLG